MNSVKKRPGTILTIKPGMGTTHGAFKQSAWTAPDQHALVLHTSGTVIVVGRRFCFVQLFLLLEFYLTLKKH
jgi:hypothetical protein